ncbi:hypothetical protein C7B65_19810 [Phormidesmis priestleyi ULC007]|uniref:SD-repeat containing protein B domain-containing protein n=1 Tax=Phormidesmis priestleyi ULC007 TaxID=1920490 RepID=A0A2T1D982_9CYAN|nr:hypothetical protein C7B65_19810 [Phormidesmis priestleyi ULC007]
MRSFVSHKLVSRFSKVWCLLASSTLAVLLCPPNPVKAQTVLPSFPGLNFQTSGPSRPANVGDWYTTNQAGKVGGYQPHQFFINLTQADITSAGGSVTISIIDAGSGGPRDEVNGGTIGAGGPNIDPTRFRLLDSAGTELSNQTLTGPADISFPAITVPGVYTVTSETGALPISGGTNVLLNNDDNGFLISIPGVSNLLIGQVKGTFQQDTGGNITVPFFALIPPGTTNLFLRDFDLDSPNLNPTVTLSYTSPTGPVPGGTISGNAVWNNNGDLNNGGDSIPVAGLANAGIWTLTLSNYSSNNQALLEANIGTTPGNRIPLFDRQPTRAGNFTITPDTTLATTIGTAVDHPFTVTNNFFTSDIINLVVTGTNGNYTAVLLDSAGNPLPESDGNNVPDTGILTPGQTRSFILRVTPNAGAPPQDVTLINATSFLDTRVRQQSNSPAPTPQVVTKTTTITANTGTGTIGDTVFNDLNGNGIQDPGETGVTRVTLTLSGTDTNNNPVNQTVVTNAAGNYQFTALNPGTYTVTATPPAGFSGTNTNPQTVTLTTGQNIPTVDFGIRQTPGAIGDTVFNDLNGNGIQDPGETGVAGATLTLRNSAGTVLATLVTDANGNYQFTNVPPGNNYTVTVTPPSGFSNTTPLVQTIATLNPGQNVPTVDFGLRQLPGTIGDFVFNDANNNGTQDPGETAGIAGVTLTLRNQAGAVVATTTTNAGGTYQFTNVTPGNYTVTATAPAGSRVTTPTPLSVTLGSGQTIDTADFGVFAQTGTLGDRVFNDFDGNGIQNGTEPGLAGVTVTLTGPNIATQTTTTSATGTYSFTGLPASVGAGYTVTISTLPAGFTPTTTSTGAPAPPGAPSLTQTVVFPAGANIDTVDFGVRQAPATIGNLVFNDLNGNGVADPGEPPLPNVPVTLLDPQGNPFASTNTNAAGNFTFTNVPPGIAFTVIATPPAGFTGTTPNPQPVPALTPGQVFNVPIGLRTAPGTIGTLVFNDLNGNGTPDPGDPGIGGVTVTLRNAAGAVVGTTITDANGNYSFQNVPPGNYTVTVTPPGGANATTPVTLPVTLAPRQSVLTANFGFGIGGQGLRLVKRITNVTRNGASIPGFDFNAIQDDPSTLNDNAPGWSQIPLRGQIRVTGGNQIRTGDEITYTVYFLSDGPTVAFGTNLCDQIPTGTGFLANTAQIQRNNTAPTAGGTPFSPLAPLPAGNACQNQTNPNGSVIFGLGDVPNTAGNNFGFVRFRVRIN